VVARCVVCQHRIREAHKRCISCGNSYHNQCYPKSPVCSHPILQYVLFILLIKILKTN
jgi:hypothetical protein